MAPVKNRQRAKATLPPKLPRSTTAISKSQSSGKNIEKLIKSRTVKAEPDSKMAHCKEFAQMSERLRELRRWLG
jgi:hypothetical protein